MNKYSIIAVLFLVLLAGCRPASPDKESLATEDVKQTQTSALIPAEVHIQFIEGSVTLIHSDGTRQVPEPGQKLKIGDTLISDADASLELSLGTMGSVRLLPSTRLQLRYFSLWMPDPGEKNAEKNSSDLVLEEGALLLKLDKLNKNDEFVIVTPNSAASVRGTSFLVEYDAAQLLDTVPIRSARTRIAVQEGEVAVLDKGPLLHSLLDGRHTNPVAGAVVNVAFSFASSAQAGQELVIGGNEGKALDQEKEFRKTAEQAYGALVYNAQESYVRGFNLEAAEDPSGFIAAPGSETRVLLQSALLLYKAVPLGSEASRYLQLLDYVQEPDTPLPALPAALPMEFFKPASDRTAEGKKPDRTSSTVLPLTASYPELEWSTLVADAALAGPVTRVGQLVLVQSIDGSIHALNSDGSVSWSAGTDVLAVTALDSSVAITERNALVMADASEGKILGTWVFDSWAALPDYKPLPVPEGIALATPKGIAILRQQNAQIIREIEVPGGIAAPMVLADRDLVAITGNGNLVFIDIGAGTIRSELVLAIGRNVYAPRYKDNRLILCNKAGRIVAVEALSMKILWDITLEQGIKSEPELDERTLYVWTSENSLRRFNILDASERGTPIPGLASPPLLSQGKLYWGSNDSFVVVADAESGSILKKIAVPDMPSVRPLLIDGTLYVGTRGGRVLRLATASL